MADISGKYIASQAGEYDDEALRKHMGAREETRLSKAWADKSGLGTVAGVTTAAVLAYLAAKSRQNRQIAAAVKRGLPVRKEVIPAIAAFGAGGGTALLSKYFYDRYNNNRNEFVY